MFVTTAATNAASPALLAIEARYPNLAHLIRESLRRTAVTASALV